MSFVFIDSTYKVVEEKFLKEFQWMKKGHCVKYNCIFQCESHNTSCISKCYFQHFILSYNETNKSYIDKIFYYIHRILLYVYILANSFSNKEYLFQKDIRTTTFRMLAKSWHQLMTDVRWTCFNCSMSERVTVMTLNMHYFNVCEIFRSFFSRR